MDIRFGRVVKETTKPTDEGTITERTVTSIHDFGKTAEKKVFIERKKINNHTDLVGEVLKFCDKYKVGKWQEPQFHILERGGQANFIEITWTPKDN